MRALKLVLAALLVLGVLPPAHAQDAAVPVLTDAPGDLKTIVAGNTQANPAGRFAAADMTGLTVEEGRDDFTLRLTVASLSTSPELPGFESTQYAVEFAHGHMVYRVLFIRMVSDHAQYDARAYVYDHGRGAFDQIGRLVVTADPASNTMAAVLPRAYVLDEHGSAPFPGRLITGFHATSTALSISDAKIGGGPIPPQQLPQTQVRDDMPDTGNGTLDLAIKLGLLQTGAARLSADVPVRASNGEANTFVFTVNATNLGPKQRYHLSVTGAPATWQVDLPSDLIEIGSNATVTLPILVSTPFAHQHGTVASFILEMMGIDDAASVGRVQLGLRFTQPPQPAGHHDTLYLHAQAPEGDTTLTTAFATVFGFDPAHMYFNTLTPDEDENDAKVPVGGQDFFFTQGLPPQQKYEWTVPLSPGLQMGLDFDLNRTGNLKVSLDTVAPMLGTVLSGRLVYTIPDGRDCGGRFNRQGAGCNTDDVLFGPGKHLNVAMVGPSSPQDLSVNAKDVLFEVPITPTKDGDYLPFKADATLVFQLNVTFTRADGFFGPHDIPKVSGGEMVLPLLEYHDPVNQVFSSLASLMIMVEGEQARMVNPGKTALYHLQLMNHGKDAASYDLELTGPHNGWARVLGDRHITLPPNSQRVLGIAVTAPSSASDNDVADLIFAAVDSKDTSARTLARLVTTVDTDAAHPDDTALVPGLESQLAHKKSPGPEPAMVLLGLAALALATRRRRA